MTQAHVGLVARSHRRIFRLAAEEEGLYSAGLQLRGVALLENLFTNATGLAEGLTGAYSASLPMRKGFIRRASSSSGSPASRAATSAAEGRSAVDSAMQAAMRSATPCGHSSGTLQAMIRAICT